MHVLTSRCDAGYFGVAAADGGELPAEILTTASEELPFCSIGLQKRGVDGALPVYKVFSKTVRGESVSPAHRAWKGGCLTTRHACVSTPGTVC